MRAMRKRWQFTGTGVCVSALGFDAETGGANGYYFCHFLFSLLYGRVTLIVS